MLKKKLSKTFKQKLNVKKEKGNLQFNWIYTTEELHCHHTPLIIKLQMPKILENMFI